MCVCKICSKHIRCASAYLYSCIRPLRPSSPSYTPRFVRTLASSTAHFLHGVQCTTPTCVQASHFCAPSQIVLWASHFCAPPQFITWASLICSTRAFAYMGITYHFGKSSRFVDRASPVVHLTTHVCIPPQILYNEHHTFGHLTTALVLTKRNHPPT